MALALTIQQLFEPTVLTTSAATLYTCPVSPASSVLTTARVRFTNTSNATVSVTAYAVPHSGTAAAGNCICNAETIAANAHMDLDIPMLAAGDFIQALASAATAVTISALSGTVISQ